MSPRLSYTIGFIQGDGHLEHKRLQVEIQVGDEQILHEIGKELSPSYSIKYRNRDTNFKDRYKSCVLCICSVDLIRRLVELGVPIGKKSDTISLPSDIVEIDYLRGLIDADGALGFTSQGLPYITLVTKSESIKDFLLRFIHDHLGIVKLASRNKRDGVYNISLFREYAVEMANLLYYDGCLALQRKQLKANDIKAWHREGSIKRKQSWTIEEDEFIKNHTIEESSIALNRSINSVKTRLWRLCKDQVISA
jgi:hypothetical protein